MLITVRKRHRRPGATLVEFALAFPVLLTLTIGLIVVALGVLQYQRVAMLARDGARWASVHGTEYHQATGNAAASAADVFNDAILPRAPGMDSTTLSSVVAWSPNNQPGSTVSVTVNYKWSPLTFLSPMTLSSTSVMTVSY